METFGWWCCRVTYHEALGWAGDVPVAPAGGRAGVPTCVEVRVAHQHENRPVAGAEVEAPWLDDTEQRMWRQWLFVTSRLPTALNAQLQAESDISLQDFEVLVALDESDGHASRIAALADALQWERSRLSHHITRMVKRGLVARQECGDDARGSIVVLTEQGRAALVQAAPGHVRAVRRLLLDALDRADLAALDRITLAVSRRLDDAHPLG